MRTISELLQESSSRHSHLCPRQVLGVRIGLAGAAALNISLPDPKKRLLVILESDGCFADGVEVATGCTIGHRSLRFEDLGKIAATFVDTKTGAAVRVAPNPCVRELAYEAVPDEKRHYFAQLQAYQIMPDTDLLILQSVVLNSSLEEILSRPGVRVQCALCGEEIINEREVTRNGLTLCRSCAGGAYYHRAPFQISQEYFPLAHDHQDLKLVH